MGFTEKRWAVWIDIEGFQFLYHRETFVTEALGDLMEGIYLIGTNCYPETPNRLFAHQTGDGFVIVSEFGSDSLEAPVSVSIALLRHVAACGRFAKATIGEGDFADIIGKYPRRIQDACGHGSKLTFSLGGGLMTIFPVMGTAWIDAVRIAKRSPTGALLTLARSNWQRLPTECVVRKASDEIISIDWMHSELPLVAQLQRKAGLRTPGPEQIGNQLLQYKTQGPPDEWIWSTSAQLGFSTPPNPALERPSASGE